MQISVPDMTHQNQRNLFGSTVTFHHGQIVSCAHGEVIEMRTEAMGDPLRSEIGRLTNHL